MRLHGYHGGPVHVANERDPVRSLAVVNGFEESLAVALDHVRKAPQGGFPVLRIAGQIPHVKGRPAVDQQPVFPVEHHAADRGDRFQPDPVVFGHDGVTRALQDLEGPQAVRQEGENQQDQQPEDAYSPSKLRESTGGGPRRKHGRGKTVFSRSPYDSVCSGA